jgi:heat shock protein HslJ
MKKIIFVLPLFIVFANCSSSRKVAKPITPGISNVNVTRNDTVTSAATASSSFTSADRDWAYTANRDTTLNGTWILEGMMGSDGNWSTTQSLNKDSAMTSITDTAMIVSDTTATSTETATNTGRSMGKRGKGRKNNRRALYDSAQARLQMDYKSTDSTVMDTTIQPFKYWGRTPSVTLNATNLVFTGSTGCNSMSGSFNFNNKDIQFGRNIVTSKMNCNEYNESNFISALKKADNYTLNGNTLELKQGNTLLLTFKKA